MTPSRHSPHALHRREITHPHQAEVGKVDYVLAESAKPISTVQNMLISALDGNHPDPDGKCVLSPATPGAIAGIVAFTNHVVVSSAVDQRWLDRHLDHEDIASSTSTPFLTAMANYIGAQPDPIDLVMGAFPLDEYCPMRPVESGDPLLQHSRIQRAFSLRHNVQVHRTDDRDGLVCLGRGFDNRLEISIEVEANARGHKLGTSLALAGRQLAREPVFAQVAPGNVASLRAFLSAGFVPLASEVLFLARRSKTELTPEGI